MAVHVQKLIRLQHCAANHVIMQGCNNIVQATSFNIVPTTLFTQHFGTSVNSTDGTCLLHVVRKVLSRPFIHQALKNWFEHAGMNILQQLACSDLSTLTTLFKLDRLAIRRSTLLRLPSSRLVASLCSNKSKHY